MDTIKIRLTVDVDFKLTPDQRVKFIKDCGQERRDLIRSKFPNNLIFGALGEGVSEVIRTEVESAGACLKSEGYISDLRVKQVAYQEAITIPPPATATPLVVNVGDRNKP